MEIVNSWHGAEGLERINHGKKLKHKIARSYQNEGVYETICKNSKITCVTAGGKTFIILGRAYLEAQDKRKQLICVPTKAIGNGFKRPEKVEFKNDTITFEIDNDLCTENGDLESKSDNLVNFIKKEINSPIQSDYICLVTHKTLVRAFQKLQESKKLSYLKNLTLHIDEAHKIHYDKNEEAERINQIGKVIKHFIKYSERKKLYFNLVTATFYRNNFENIVPSSFKWDKEIKVNSLEFLKYCQYINGFNYSLRIDENEYTESIKKIFDENPNKPTIIFMPHSSSNQCLSYTDKHGSVEEIKKIINHNLNIKSLVNEKERMDELNYIENHKDEVDIVLNIKVASEGFDWENCSRVIICGHRTSLIEIPQNIGRAMRDHKSKKNKKDQPEIIQIISKVDVENSEKEDLKEVFNQIMKLVGGQLLLLSDLYSREAIKMRKIGNKTTSIADYLNENMSENERKKFDINLTNEFIRFATMNEDEYTDDDLREIIREKITDFGLEDSMELIRYFLNDQKRRTLDTELYREDVKKIKRRLKKLYKGYNIDDVAIDLVMDEIDSLGWIKNLSSKFFDIDKFTELEEKVLKRFPRIEKIKELKQWVIEHNNL